MVERVEQRDLVLVTEQGEAVEEVEVQFYFNLKTSRLLLAY
jgi:hypothetical protein